MLAVLVGIPLVVGVIAMSVVGGNYNNLITLRESAKSQQAEIENAMQRRADLVPQIVGATRGALEQEREVFDDISKAHAAFTKAEPGTQEKLDTGAALGSALRGYLVVAQQYPDLRSLEIIRELNVTIEGTENRISVARTRYNESVEEYNKAVQRFPNNVFANMFGFQQMQRFEMEDRAKQPPQVDLELNN